MKPTKAQPSVTVAIPAYNEGKIIRETLASIHKVFSESGEFSGFEIIVVDDGSTDETALEVAASPEYGKTVFLLSHHINLGRGYAVRTAMANFKGEVLVILDADLSYSPQTGIDLALPILKRKADVTLASPYSPGGSVRNVPVARAQISKIGNRILSRAFHPPRPTSTSIVRGYGREFLSGLSLLSSGKELNLELLYKAELLGFKILDIPAVLEWPLSRKNRDKRKGILSLLSLAPVVRSHLLFQFVSRPGILFGVPIASSALLTFYGIVTLVIAYFREIAAGSESPLRAALLDGALTLSVTGFSFALGLLFTVIFLLVVQGKLYFEETFLIQSKIYKELLKKNTL